MKPYLQVVKVGYGFPEAVCRKGFKVPQKTAEHACSLESQGGFGCHFKGPVFPDEMQHAPVRILRSLYKQVSPGGMQNLQQGPFIACPGSDHFQMFGHHSDIVHQQGYIPKNEMIDPLKEIIGLVPVQGTHVIILIDMSTFMEDGPEPGRIQPE
jgi:hypothetical protein